MAYKTSRTHQNCAVAGLCGELHEVARKAIIFYKRCWLSHKRTCVWQNKPKYRIRKYNDVNLQYHHFCLSRITSTFLLCTHGFWTRANYSAIVLPATHSSYVCWKVPPKNIINLNIFFFVLNCHLLSINLWCCAKIIRKIFSLISKTRIRTKRLHNKL